MLTENVARVPGEREGPIPPARDEAAFAALVAEHETRIFNFVQRMMGTGAEDARDLTQDVFLKAWLAMVTGRYADQARLQGWLYRIATNVCLDELRHRKLVRWTKWDAVLAALPPRKQASLFTSLDPEDDPSRVTLARECGADVERVLGQLHPKYRLVLLLREYHDLAYDEIASALSTTRAAVKSLLFRDRGEFRVVWARAERRTAAAAGAVS